MSASESERRGGQPSTTQPIAGPWLSPQVVTRKRWPKLLWDMRGVRLGPRASDTAVPRGGGGHARPQHAASGAATGRDRAAAALDAAPWCEPAPETARMIADAPSRRGR